jgi:hypothetical protein
MRVIIIGAPGERRQFREVLEHTPLEIVAEYASRAEALDASCSGRRNPRGFEGDRTGRSQRADTGALDRARDRGAGTDCRGAANKAIAATTRHLDQTVKFHASSIQESSARPNRTDAVRRAVRRGLLTL